MTDTEKKIAEIREALEKATPGPWKWIDSGGLERKKLVGEWEIMNFGVSAPYSEIAGQEPDDNDAHLIANAPEWLRFLLDELERLEREYAEERAAHNAHVAELCELEKENRKLRKELDLLQELAVKVTVEREKERKSAQQETERLRQLYEREREIAGRALEQVKNLREERNQDSQWIKKASENVTQLQKERDKLIECLRFYERLARGREVNDGGRRARTLLAEIGVTVE